MNKLNKVAMLFASAALATAAGAQTIDNWKNNSGDAVWKNGTNELCWRNANWTPATAAPGCDGALVAAAPAAPVAGAPAVVAPVVAAPAASKVTYAADAFFDFDKSVIKAEGKAKLDELAGKLGQVNVETIVATGHTDSVGADAYNQALSVRRANAVKAYLVSKGVAAERVLVEGKGEAQPVASNATKEGRAQNRRVVVEVVGVKK